MSRFGLRSASDVLKQSEERPNRRKTSSVQQVSILTKQSIPVKETKYITNINDGNIIDDIKIEIEDVERVADVAEGLPTSKSINGEDDEDEYDDREGVSQPQPLGRGLICSLPLDRISDVILKLNLNRSKFNTSNQKHYNEKSADDIDESVDNDDDEEDDINISKNSTTTTKYLCLYCDKKFLSHKMQLKHIEKCHCLQQDRRCSGRKLQLQQTQEQRKRKPTIGTQSYPGCTLCQKNKCLSPSISLPSSELNALFVHLADCHPDKYFGCKVCVLRFQNITDLSKHMEVIHKSCSFSIDESSRKSRDNDNDGLVANEKTAVGEKSKYSLKKQQRVQKTLASGTTHNGTSFGHNLPTTPCTSTITSNTSIIGAEEPILSRLGLTQNRLPNNRKGMRLRREKLLPELLLKSEQNNQSTNNFGGSISTSSSLPAICSPKLRGKTVKAAQGEPISEVIFRVPTRSDFLSCVFDDNFYKEVVSNVRNNLIFHLDGKIMGTTSQTLNNAVLRHVPQPHIRSTLVKSPILLTAMDSEIHAATSLTAVTAFPTLLTAAQFGGEGSFSKLRRPHTKNSWKWKWDSVKKFKLINEGGKIVKKMKHPIFGLRDLSKLDMWTQLTMRKKREVQLRHQSRFSDDKSLCDSSSETSSDASREEKQRLNEQLNMILDMRLLPHIILEQNEQAIIKLENDEFGIAPLPELPEDSVDNLMAQTFADENFLSMLNLIPNLNSHNNRPKLVLSGEWARPRCYLCMCCGAKFEKQKSLEEHKMFRHSQILSTHYEVVGRELLNGNLLRHLFLPKKALSRYANEMGSHHLYGGAARRLFWHKNEALAREITNNEESSDSLQSVLNSCTTNSPSVKNSSCTEDCDIESKAVSTTALDIIPNSTVVSPTHSLQSCSSLSSTGQKSNSKIPSTVHSSASIASSNSCSKCGRKCSGIPDLYRHMLDCSGDYVWSLAKKRKYRYYCGSKKRRPCNKHSILELRKNKIKQAIKVSPNTTENTEDGCASTSSNFPKTKTSPRPRPSDAESIKKMLENLPPKRVCKKIFPTLSKTKKNTQNIKPKLLAKHKIYSSLRKTRVRQMSQAAKILSKTKSQLNKSIKMTTRSSAVTRSSKAAKKATNNRNKLKRFLSKNVKNKPIAPKATSPSPCSPDVEQSKQAKREEQNAVKVDVEKEQETFKAENKINLSENLLPQASDNDTHDVVNTLPLSCNKEKECEFSNSTITVAQCFRIPSVSPSKTPVESSQKSKSEPAVQGFTLMDVASQQSSSTYQNVPPACDSNTNIANNKNLKRSKRISDCIAMLTGKLEQKLKSATTVTESVGSVKQAVNSTIISTGKTFNVGSQVTPEPQLELPVSQAHERDPDEEVHKAAAWKKTPKRKTISRRILKTDLEDLSGALVTTQDSQVMQTATISPIIATTPKVAQGTLPITDNHAEMIATKKNGSSVKTHTNKDIHTKATVEKFIPMPESIFTHVDANQIKVIPTALIPPAVPPPLSLNNPSLISKVPLFLPLENLRLPHVGQLPLSLPMPVAAPAPLPPPIDNATQSCSGKQKLAGTTPGLHLMPPTAPPLITAVPPAHLPPLTNITLPVASFSIPIATEPLNLSNSSKNVQKQSQDLSCSSRQRITGLPARRQTICGFEARNFVMFDEMEPLDLSKKSRPESKTSAVHIKATSPEKAAVLLPVQNTVTIALGNNFPANANLLSAPTLPAEALLNKPFYSNLDLLRIPQVRNPTVGQVTSVMESTPPPSSPNTALANTSSVPATTTIKPSVKKRNKSNITAGLTPNKSCIESIVCTTSSTPIKLNYSKENIMLKKDTASKSKPMLRMDEEVINHIDDAINSVINAVKASLDSEEAEKTKHLSAKTTDDVALANDSSGEFKRLTASRRNLRSKTLDCRPLALTQSLGETVQPTTAAISQNYNTTPNVSPLITVKDINDMKESKQCMFSQQAIFIPPDLVSNEPLPIFGNQNSRHEETTELTVTESHHAQPSIELNNDLSSGCQKGITKNDTTISMNVAIPKISNESIHPPLEKSVVSANIPVVIAVPEADPIVANTTPINQTNLDVEQMSNNNNTSSGFHSSAQSDQQASVMSINTSVSASAPALTCETKKKQRRRRKNELAAIVADQLLESFKLDKARRDNLKRLENLAYEKSEDLLLTGMLLMSSTKRNVNSSSTTNTSTTALTTSTTTTAVMDFAVEESLTSNKCSNKIEQNIDSFIFTKVKVTEDKADNNTIAESDKNPQECIETNDGKKTCKRKQYRRRGKVDNENISKLKSSLESFSIDIERQLTEYEAKNVNVFKNVPTSEAEKATANSTTATSANLKPSVILRPSILSMTMEACTAADNQMSKASGAIDTNKTAVSSRDPRLNKNIHKEGEKTAEFVGEEKTTTMQQNPQPGPVDIGDMEEDNYLTEIAKNVNEKIITENEEFAFKDDGFEMANDMGADDSNSKFSRPPTSMSVRSAPNLNDDRSNFGSICDENTNTEVMDMDLDDEMSVYTSYSQDLGRGRGRKRRRRRSILLTRKPKKRASSRDVTAEKIECILCKKVFYSANSLSKHNMTLAHVSKVSEKEYLLSKSIHSTTQHVDEVNTFGALGPYARRCIRRATISEPPSQIRDCIDTSLPPLPMPPPTNHLITNMPQSQQPLAIIASKPCKSPETTDTKREDPTQSVVIEQSKLSTTLNYPKDGQGSEVDGNNCSAITSTYNGNSRLNLNPDERLFFECCNILKSAETPRINNVIVSEDCNNLNTNYGTYPFSQECIKDTPNLNMDNALIKSSNTQADRQVSTNAIQNQRPTSVEQSNQFRDPQYINISNCYNKSAQEHRSARSPTYSGISHLSAVTNTTSRFKTKAAMKGYENINTDLIHLQESKSRTICKLTELAEIALGNEDKPNSHSFSPIQSSSTLPRPLTHVVVGTSKVVAADNGAMRMKGLATPDFATLLAVENPKETNVQTPRRNERSKNNETRSSTSSKTIMHSSIIKAAVEEHQKATSTKIIIPERPFKNIGLEEKETITFQKPRTPAVHLLTEDNSVSTGSFSDRDDYDFGSLSCDEETSVRESIDKHPKANSTESSSESSRATAKTFENKSLIMGRIFKNVSTKTPAKSIVGVKKQVKSVGVQKDQTPPTIKADLNQLFDELRDNSGVDASVRAVSVNIGAIEGSRMPVVSNRPSYKQQRDVSKYVHPQPKHTLKAASPPAIVSSTTATPSISARKNKPRAKPKPASKTRKDISKLQAELGMSPDEIKKLIDDGQRKSKRRCATNRPKNFEWSSDEYEEFLPTKDIIALIEEKEKEEKRKKRKTSTHLTSINSKVDKAKDTSDVTSSTKEPKRRNSKKNSTELQSNLHLDRAKVANKTIKPRKSTGLRKENVVVSTTATAAETIKSGCSVKRATVENRDVKTKSAKISAKPQAKSAPKSQPAKACKKRGRANRKKSFTDSEEDEDNENYDDDDDDDDEDFLIADLKQKPTNKTRPKKVDKTKAGGQELPIVTSSVKGKPPPQTTKKRSSTNIPSPNATSKAKVIDMPSGAKIQKQSPQKGKRKNATNQSAPRRKRTASEKLYYWSSSSDEDFGRIKNTTAGKNNSLIDNFDNGGEQYQKHGWIVGDSHKKLVTLLAIAKGNKKVDSKSGVKKNVPKKRN